MVQDPPELPDEGEAWLDSLEPVAENLAGGAAVDWEAADSSELTASHKALLRQLRAIAQIASAHERFAREADVLLDPAAMETDRTIAATVGQGELRTWGQLIVRSYLGRGSFGDVYRAWDPRLDREVALKLLTPPATDETARSSTVISEGRALARVRHPNVVTVYGADQIGGRIGVWMEFVEGRTLTQRIAADGPLGPAETAAIGADLARALAAVHKAGLLHRDVKAQNVICEAGGRNVLTDFGTAVPHEEKEPAGGGALFEGTPAVDTPPSTITPRHATLAGTPLYLAPEVLDGADQTPRSDIYALGVLLFHGLTGTFPVTGRTLREVHERHRVGQRTSLSEARSDLPLALVSVVDRALAPDPAARSQTADEMAAALDDVARDARAVPTGVRVRRTTWVAAAVAIATLGVAAWLAGFGTNDRRAGPGAGKGIATTQVWTGPSVRTGGTVSPDGRYLSSVDGDGNLALHDLLSGKDRRLTDVGNSSWSQYAQESAISRDGTQVAYSWYDSSKKRAELRALTLDAAGAAASRTLVDHPDVEWIVPHDWSPDGKWIAVSLGRRDRTVHIGRLSTVDAAFEELSSVDWRGPTRVVFSPDGRFIAYDLPVGDRPARDVFVMDTRTRLATPTIVHRANDVVAGWAPNGTSLLFTSDRSGSIGVWEVPMANGAPAGTPTLLKSDLGSRSFSINVTSAGTLFYGLQTASLNVYTAEVDFETGRLLAPPAEAAESYLLRNTGPDWSPDGRLAFLSDRPRNVSAITVSSGASSEPILELRPAMDAFQRVRWAPDGSLTVQGTDLTGRRGVFRVDARSGNVSPILTCEPGVDCVQASFTPGGDRLVYLRFTARDSALVVRNMSSGAEVTLAQQSGARALNGASLSRDGSQVSYVQRDPVAKASILWVHSLSGGRPREVARYATPAALLIGAEWTSDGRHLIFAKSDDGTVPNATLWSLQLDGSRPPVQIEGLHPQLGLNALRVHPDGRRVAFSQGRSGAEVWMLSNFLPLLRTR